MKEIDHSFIGKRFGKLTVVGFDHKNNGIEYWLCDCQCGKTTTVRKSNLLSGNTTSCGCLKNIRKTLTGSRFGSLTVIDFDHVSNLGHSYWLCECDCGNIKIIRGSELTTGRILSCGCIRRDRESLVDSRFGRLTVIGLDHYDSRHNSHWLCECDCGNQIVVVRGSLTTGNTTSCGCYRQEISTTHGLSGGQLYHVWDNMLQRCENENKPFYYRYGGRGIYVCDEWHDFEIFRDWAMENGYEPGLSIDRINNNDGYTPENCRWADRITQANNTSGNRFITYNNDTHTIAEWARIFGIKYGLLRNRVDRNDMRDFEEYFGLIDMNYRIYKNNYRCEDG